MKTFAWFTIETFCRSAIDDKLNLRTLWLFKTNSKAWWISENSPHDFSTTHQRLDDDLSLDWKPRRLCRSHCEKILIKLTLQLAKPLTEIFTFSFVSRLQLFTFIKTLKRSGWSRIADRSCSSQARRGFYFLFTSRRNFQERKNIFAIISSRLKAERKIILRSCLERSYFIESGS